MYTEDYGIMNINLHNIWTIHSNLHNKHFISLYINRISLYINRRLVFVYIVVLYINGVYVIYIIYKFKEKELTFLSKLMTL